MKYQKSITLLSLSVAFFAAIATLLGIVSKEGPGRFEYESIRGKSVEIYGEGIYEHMSAGVAIQGIAQDFVTLFLAIPILLVTLYFTRKQSTKSRLILTGVIGYFFVTYLFYLTMAMYNTLFLIYVLLAGLSFYAFSLCLISLLSEDSTHLFPSDAPTSFPGWFLIINAVIIGLLWLSVVIPPLLEGSIYPDAVEHYTTLIVQGLDLALLLPLSFISGYQVLKKTPIGYIMATVYLIFLSKLMAALVAKITYMGLEGYSIIPAIFIIPVLNILAAYSAFTLLSHLVEPTTT